jgi:hypothetical protein
MVLGEVHVHWLGTGGEGVRVHSRHEGDANAVEVGDVHKYITYKLRRTQLAQWQFQCDSVTCDL